MRLETARFVDQQPGADAAQSVPSVPIPLPEGEGRQDCRDWKTNELGTNSSIALTPGPSPGGRGGNVYRCPTNSDTFTPVASIRTSIAPPSKVCSTWPPRPIRALPRAASSNGRRR